MPAYDLHIHTVKGSSDSSLTVAQLIEEARAIGLDGVGLTEHGGGWDGHEFDRVFEDAGFSVFRGLEVETDMGHVLVYGLHSYVNGIHKANELRRVVDRVGGVMISAHPFRNIFNRPPYNLNLLFKDSGGYPATPQEALVHPLFELVDGLEVANGSNTDQEDVFAHEVANRLGLGGTGGSDAHSVHGLGRCVTVFDASIRSEADLIEALKAGAFTSDRGFHTRRPRGAADQRPETE